MELAITKRELEQRELEGGREVASDGRIMPTSRRQLWARRIGMLSLILLAGGVVVAVGSVKVTETFLSVLGLWAFVRTLERFHRGRRLLLRWVLLPRRDAVEAITEIEELALHAAFEPRLQACFVASIAELELRRGEVERGYRLFAGLRERGWHPSSLMGGVTLWSSACARTVATMATVEALDGDEEEAAAALPLLARRGGEQLALLPSAVLGLRRGASQQVLERIAGYIHDHGGLPPADREALAYLYELAAASSGVLPFRGAALKRAFESPGGSSAKERERRWLVMRRLPLLKSEG